MRQYLENGKIDIRPCMVRRRPTITTRPNRKLHYELSVDPKIDDLG